LAHKLLRAIYASPWSVHGDRSCAIAAHYLIWRIQPLDAVSEVDFGAWQGGEINKLVHRKMWPVIQTVPSRAYFPGGESVRQAQGRAIDALERLAQVHPRQMVAVVSHSDIIKLILAYYLGMPIDLFQRIVIAPASISVVELDHARPMVVQINDTSTFHPGSRGRRTASHRTEARFERIHGCPTLNWKSNQPISLRWGRLDRAGSGFSICRPPKTTRC
jgi:probable phosphoglycerate mutase